MAHEEVLKSFYARLKGVGTESLVRIVDLARENGVSYRYLTTLLQDSGLKPLWIGGKAFVMRKEAQEVLTCAS